MVRKDRKTPEGNAADALGSAAYIFDGRPVLRLCIVAMLCALGIVGRIALWTVPNVQPVTALIIIISVHIGGGYGILASVVVTTVTNLFMGSFGLWTLYQSAAWVFIAVISYFLFRKRRGHTALLIWAFAAGFAYGFIVDILSWRLFLPETSAMGFWTYKLSSLLFDFYHAFGNAVFMRFLEPLFVRLCVSVTHSAD